MRHIGITAIIAASALGLGACAYNAGSRDYHAYQVAGEQSVRFGVVESVRDGGSGQVAGAIGGAILGGIIGHNVEASANAQAGVEVTVLLDSGAYVAVVQAPDEVFRSGDRVRVLSGRGITRVTH
jgi:outer membrane lipoprotein SlyB